MVERQVAQLKVPGKFRPASATRTHPDEDGTNTAIRARTIFLVDDGTASEGDGVLHLLSEVVVCAR